jgi:hypothetical protein
MMDEVQNIGFKHVISASKSFTLLYNEKSLMLS